MNDIGRLQQDMSFIVYSHTNTKTNNCYIGWTSKSVEERWKRHVYDAKQGSQYYFHRAIEKYGIENWTAKVIEICDSEIDALKAESKWIKFFESNNPDHGYNSSSGGEASVPNEATRKRLSEAQRKRFTNPEERLKTSLGAKNRCKISEKTKQLMRENKLGNKNPQFGRVGKNAPHFGKTHSEKTKQIISQKKRGQKLSEEAKRKCSEASKKRWSHEKEKQHVTIDQEKIKTEI